MCDVDILLVQKEDCAKGVVFDGVESSFTNNAYSSAFSILKALNNRTYIFAIALKQDYSVLKENEKRAQEEKGA